MSKTVGVNVSFFKRTECPVCFCKLVSNEDKLFWMEEILSGISQKEKEVCCPECRKTIRVTLMFSDNPKAVSSYRSGVRSKRNYWRGCTTFAPII